jgi:hypothetical protein
MMTWSLVRARIDCHHSTLLPVAVVYAAGNEEFKSDAHRATFRSSAWDPDLVAISALAGLGMPRTRWLPFEPVGLRDVQSGVLRNSSTTFRRPRCKTQNSPAAAISSP